MNDLIREGVPTDVAGIFRLTQQLGYSLSEGQVESNLNRIIDDEKRSLFVVVVDGAAMGMVSVAVDFAITEPPYALLTAIVVDESIRGQGQGKLLLQAVEDWTRRQGLSKVRLRANSIRTDAHGFYQRSGFALAKDQRVFIKELG